ncbi:hypothetical protein K435DRAFT_877311 [Dendrothele bispora CBS 962.96]|uniref:Uncharacterized protein n=1 Tax=Dendrothele bispora (strain CBS 962.96) TaxID=1314807 RepID=A0A4S8KR81_DENBC|nr:hypothetical protein K435DRAFT_877311 [Dendrothele bispora CBS 962.96]
MRFLKAEEGIGDGFKSVLRGAKDDTKVLAAAAEEKAFHYAALPLLSSFPGKPQYNLLSLLFTRPRDDVFHTAQGTGTLRK